MNSAMIADLFTNKMQGADFLKMQEPIVYAWFKGEECLYVGASWAGVGRLLNYHNVIDACEPVGDDSVIYYKHVKLNTQVELLEIEMELIKLFTPKYNRKALDKVCREIECRTCKKRFMQKRFWQECCSPACRSGNPIETV